MTKIGELIAERNRIKTAHASMPVLPMWNARVGFDDDGKLNIADYTIRNVSEFFAWLNEWYADPAPAQPDAETLRKAACFDELVREAERVVADYDQANRPENMCDELKWGDFCGVENLRQALASAKA